MSIEFLAWCGFCLGIGLMLGAGSEATKGTNRFMLGLGAGLFLWGFGLFVFSGIANVLA